ncbi:MAG: DeoR/GlpR transcriptional regulator, partial [Sedimentisphaerales bacterium]|nr:DeoR/GlpR transcriptional regulator [Sedimentisphaerales bacterium]
MIQTIQKRREEILAIAYRSGHVLVKTLAEAIGVSEATIRRDLQGLAADGHIELTHGGARVIFNSDYSFISKSLRNVDAKNTIARMAADIINDGDQIFLDSGTTCFQMTGHLRAKRSITIILNSVRTAQELRTPGINVLILGGQYRPDRMDTVGPMAFESLERLRGYRAFLGTDGISMDFGLTSVDIESAHLLSIVARNAKDCVLIADSSKFDQPSLYKIAGFNAISTIVTDQAP